MGLILLNLIVAHGQSPREKETMSIQIETSSTWLEIVIEEFIRSSPENTLKNTFADKAFIEPLVGFSSGDDPIYEYFKEVVGDFHWTPQEAFQIAFPNQPVDSSELTAISWILPHITATKIENSGQDAYPSERWARGRVFGEEINDKLRIFVIDALEKAGIQAMAPSLLSEWGIRKSSAYVYASNWSERHAAYASGLGTFGLCDGLITARGKAMRSGSVVARTLLPSTARPYDSHHEYCLFFTQGTCGKCISRCPVGALSEAGHDKVKCYQHLIPTTSDYMKSAYNIEGYACGLCQTGVPCESKIPVNSDVMTS